MDAGNGYCKTRIRTMKRIIMRILGFPFVFGLMIIASLVNLFSNIIQFIRFGGELINYEKDEIRMINDVYKELKLLNNKLDIKKKYRQ
jgi:uncharacterized membrane protein (DUF106 family)